MWALDWALIPSQGKDPKIPFSPSSEAALPPPWAGQLEGNHTQSCSSHSSGQAPALPQPCSCCQQPLSGTWDLPWGCPWAGSRQAALAVRILCVLQPWVWGVSSIPHFWVVFCGAGGARADPMGMLLPNPYLFLAGAPGQAALVPWQLTVTLARFFGLSLWTKGTQRGEESCSSGSGNEGLMPG